MSVPTYIPERAGSDTYKFQQPVLIDDGFYAGFFSRYSPPKDVPRYQSEGTEKKIWLGFTVTHGINERLLPRFTQASTFIPFKMFYSEQNGMKSRYFEFIHALTARKFSTQELNAMALAEIPSLNDLVGHGVVMQISRSSNVDKNGITNLNVKSFQAPSETMRQALIELRKNAEFGVDEKNKHRQLVMPAPEFITEVPRTADAFDDSFPSESSFLEDEIPF